MTDCAMNTCMFVENEERYCGEPATHRELDEENSKYSYPLCSAHAASGRKAGYSVYKGV